MFGVIGSSVAQVEFLTQAATATQESLNSAVNLSCNPIAQNIVSATAPTEMAPTTAPHLELSLGLTQSPWSRPTLWGSPKNYFDIPPLVADPELMFPLREPVLFDFTLPSLTEGYPLWQSGQWFASPRYSLWPENLPAASTFPENLEDLLNHKQKSEQGVTASGFADEDGGDFWENYSCESSGSSLKSSSVSAETKVVEETVLPIFQPQEAEQTAVNKVLAAPVETPVFVGESELVPTVVSAQRESQSLPLVLMTPYTETAVVVHGEPLTSAAKKVLPETFASGMYGGFISTDVFTNSAVTFMEAAQNIFGREFFPITIEFASVVTSEIPTVFGEAHALTIIVAGQGVSHLSTVSFADLKGQFDFTETHHGIIFSKTDFQKNGATVFQSLDNVPVKFLDHEVYLHSGMMLAQAESRASFAARRDEVLFLDQATRRLHTVSQNSGKDQGEQNPNGRAPEIYQIVLDQNKPVIKQNIHEDNTSWQPTRHIVVDTVLV